MSKFSADDYTAALQSLMPTGTIWPKNPDAIQTAVLSAIAQSFAATDSDAISLLVNAFPSTAVMMLADWEGALGLPDLCSIGEVDTITKRQAAVVAKFIATGGQSAAYFISVAFSLGYAITITEFRPALAGMSACGDAINGDEWPFTWRINAETTTMTYAQCGVSYCGDPLESWGNKQLECRLKKISPAHTIVDFGYTYFGFAEENVYAITDDMTGTLDTAINTYL